LKELGEFFKRRAAIEDEYAKKLRTLVEDGVVSPSLSRREEKKKKKKKKKKIYFPF
jgi:hypothetical protein